MEIEPWQLLDVGARITAVSSIEDLLSETPKVIGDAISVEPDMIGIYNLDGTEMVPHGSVLREPEYRIPEAELKKATEGKWVGEDYVLVPAMYGGKAIAVVIAGGKLNDPQLNALEKLTDHIANAIHSTGLIETDYLTGLRNRRIFNQTLERMLAHSTRSGHPCCVGFMDLDGFKGFNDTYGHGPGDEALKHLARILEDSVRTSEIVARYGGEEFVVGFPRTGLEESVKIGERMRRNLERTPVSIKDKEGQDIKVALTMSTGVASSEHFHSVGGLVHAADMAMQEAKRNGRNRLYIHLSSKITPYKR